LKTKGAVVWEINAPWSIDEIEIGDPRHGEVTVPSPSRCLVYP
jgi:S-(hydroxymethyl)glutathione dehydrogenase / alcohol dehydrogenase